MDYENTAECRSFQLHYAELLETFRNPTVLAARLYSAGLLSRDTRRKIDGRDLTESASEILAAIETAIQLDSNNFHKFMEVLEKDSSMQHLCGKLRSTYGECDNVCLSTSTDQCIVF